MIVVNHADGQSRFPDATRVSTDEHNNLEVWGGSEGDELVWVCAVEYWRDVSIGDTNGEHSNPA